MAKQLRRLIFLALALAVVCLAAVLLLSQPEDEPVDAAPAATAQTLLPAENAERIEVRNAHGSYAMTPNGLDGMPALLVETAYLQTVFDGIHALSLERLDGASVSEAVYGLQSPSAQADILYAGGQQRALCIGVKEGVSKRYYCSLDGDDAVYLMNGAVAEKLLAPAQSYLSLQVTPDCLASSPLMAIGDITFTTQAGSLRIRTASQPDETLARELISFGAVTHVIDGPGVIHEVDRTYGQEIFGSLLDLYAQSLEAYGLTEEEVLAAGFAQPDLTVCFDLKNGDKPDTPVEAYTLRLLDQEDGSWLAAVNDRGVIYRIGEAPFVRADYALLVNRWFLSPLLADLKELRIATPDAEHLYEISGQAAELHVAKQGKEVDLSRFRSFYSLAVSAASNGDYLGNVQPEGNPLLRMEFHYRDEAKEADVLELYELDERRCVAAVNGAAEFAMRNGFTQVLLEAITALETGAEIPQTW